MVRGQAHVRAVARGAALAAVLAASFAGCAAAGPSIDPSATAPTMPPLPSHSFEPAASGSTRADDGASIVEVRAVADRQIDLIIDSPAMTGRTSARVLLPVDFDAQPDRHWPVLYALHGANTQDALSSWFRHPEVVETIGSAGVLVVTPDAGKEGWYSDWWNEGKGGWPAWETFHLVELRQLLERNYRAGDRWAVMGMSMGGYGAIAYAARHPGMFVMAASFSGLLDTNAWSWGDYIWGARREHPEIFRAHNPVDIAANLRGTQLYIAWGNGEPGPLDSKGTGADRLERELGRTNDTFVARLKALGIPATIDGYGPGTHTWPYWSRSLETVMPMLLSALGAAS